MRRRTLVFALLWATAAACSEDDTSALDGLVGDGGLDGAGADITLLDGRDNDCDKVVDEDFVNRVLLNDGKGTFTTSKASGVGVLDPTSSAALGDGNGDGKLDVYWGNWLITYPQDAAVPDRYFTGNGDGTFADAHKRRA